MSQRRIEINNETGDVYLIGQDGNRPIGHVEDFLNQHTPLARAVQAYWKRYLQGLGPFAAGPNLTTSFSARRRTSDHVPYSDR